uniref:C-type lectin domain-containing protein n=1 Tax=Gadus morhua TaxID=8049 RepID=A0A8C4ZZG2_GADMO
TAQFADISSGMLCASACRINNHSGLPWQKMPGPFFGPSPALVTALDAEFCKYKYWTDAQQHCREQNGDLATVDNVADLQHLQESRTGFNYDDDFMWIGLYDDRTRWKWSLGDQDYKVDFSGNEENCTTMYYNGSWMDKSCDARFSIKSPTTSWSQTQ